MLPAVSQRPSHLSAIRLGPPAVQFRKIDAPIDEHLHAARSTCFPGPPWRIYPDVHSLDKLLRQQHIVVAQEDDVGAGLRLADKLYPFMDQFLSRTVFRMGLTGDDELHRAVGNG